MRDSTDPEFLHQMRVSVRGARALMRPLRRMYDSPDLERFASELAWVARISGPPRDLDVFYELLPDYIAPLSPDVQGDLEAFRRLLDGHRRRAVRELRHELDSKRYRNLMRNWKRLAHRATRHGRRPKQAARRTAMVWIWKRYERACRSLRTLRADSPPIDIHRARIQLKKLRYLIEFFRSLFPAKKVERLLDPIKEAQDALGILNDLLVHRSMIRSMARSAEFTHQLPTDTVVAMGELSAALEASRRQRLTQLGPQMKSLTGKRFRRRFRALYKP